MFQNVLMTSLTTPLSNINELSNWDNRPFTTIWPEVKQNPNKATNLTTIVKKRKAKRVRTAFTTNQLNLLEKVFATSKYIDSKKRNELAGCLNISEKIIKIWFQNRRMREKALANTDESVDSSSNDVLSSVQKSPYDDVKVEPTNSEYSPQFEGMAESQYQMGYEYDYFNNYAQTQRNAADVSQSFPWYTNVYPAQYPFPQYNNTNYQYSQQNDELNLNEFQ